MNVSDVAFVALGAVFFSPVILALAILRRLVVPVWVFQAKEAECDNWRHMCDEATRLASTAATIAENLSKSAQAAHLSEKPSP